MPLNNFNMTSRPLSLIQSILIKLTVFSLGVALILWFGWSVPQANQLRSSSPQAHEVSQDLETPVFSSSLDINHGTREEFQALPGIGPVLASRIIEHRNTIGLFADIEDLKDIDGIGEKKLAQLRPYIKINHPANHDSQKRPSSS
jgi:competence ComEA-like helix-hairpin-helix protein